MFYKSLIETFYQVSNLDLKLEKLAKLEKENLILKAHLEKAKLDNQNFNEHLKELDLLHLKVKDLINKKDSLEEENNTLKFYLKDKNLEKDYQIYLKILLYFHLLLLLPAYQLNPLSPILRNVLGRYRNIL